MILAAAGASVIISTVLLAILILSFRRKEFLICDFVKFWKQSGADNNQELETFLKKYGSLTPRRYSYSDVKKMTNSFSIKLGQGGYGTVYKGKLLQDGSRAVAVKILNESKGNGEEFTNEVSCISRTSHINIVTLLGFCFEGQKKRALIYEFLANGSLEKFIYGGEKLEWRTLYKIAVGIARGLEYLHCGCNTRILHFDIKPHNILLDEEFCPKITDFGLAKLCTRKESMISTMAARGTVGYIAPEIVCKNIGGVSHKSDVYSYGMMVLEMVGGRKNLDAGADRASETYFPHWIYTRINRGQELGLSGIKDDEEDKLARKMLIVSLWCIQTDPFSRPTISNVLEMLEGTTDIDALQMPPKFFFHAPSTASSQGST